MRDEQGAGMAGGAGPCGLGDDQNGLAVHPFELIRRYLESGVMVNGVVVATEEGTPQGGPLSSLLANILLDDLDKELERRGHRFVRYADDCNIYVRTRRAGQRVKESTTAFLKERLRLTVNEGKSAVDRPWRRKFLGFSMLPGKTARIRLAPQTLYRVKDKIRQLTSRTRGRDAWRSASGPSTATWAAG